MEFGARWGIEMEVEVERREVYRLDKIREMKGIEVAGYVNCNPARNLGRGVLGLVQQPVIVN